MVGFYSLARVLSKGVAPASFCKKELQSTQFMLEKLGAFGCVKKSILSINANQALAHIFWEVRYQPSAAGVSSIAAIADAGSGIKFQVQLDSDHTGTNKMIVDGCDQTRNINAVIVAFSNDECSRK